jgi:hypothetical protein
MANGFGGIGNYLDEFLAGYVFGGFPIFGKSCKRMWIRGIKERSPRR